MELFESSIEYLKAKQDEAAARYTKEQANRRSSIKGPGSASPRNGRGSVGGSRSPAGGGLRTGAGSPRLGAASPR